MARGLSSAKRANFWKLYPSRCPVRASAACVGFGTLDCGRDGLADLPHCADAPGALRVAGALARFENTSSGNTAGPGRRPGRSQSAVRTSHTRSRFQGPSTAAAVDWCRNLAVGRGREQNACPTEFHRRSRRLEALTSGLHSFCFTADAGIVTRTAALPPVSVAPPGPRVPAVSLEPGSILTGGYTVKETCSPTKAPTTIALIHGHHATACWTWGHIS